MALPPLATVDELSNWLGEPIEDNSADARRAEGLLHLASTLVRHATGRKSWVVPDSDPPALLPIRPDELGEITVAVAARGYTNPDGLTAERIDDGSVSYKVEESGLYLTETEKDLLAPLAGRAHGGLRTIGVYRGDVPVVGEESWIVNGPSPVPDEVL